MSTYGETWSKRVARVNLWQNILESSHNGVNFNRLGRILVLCGPDRGDVRFLNARLDLHKKLGGGPVTFLHGRDQTIVAVDLDIDTLAHAVGDADEEAHYPSVVYKHASALEVAKEYKGEFSIIYLDLFSNISAKVLDEIAKTIHFGMASHGAVAINLMIGREKEDVSAGLLKMNLRNTLGGGDTLYGAYPRDVGRDRANYIYCELMKNLGKYRSGVLVPRGIYTYSARKKREDGVFAGVTMLQLYWEFVRPHKYLKSTEAHFKWGRGILRDKVREFDGIFFRDFGVMPMEAVRETVVHLARKNGYNSAELADIYNMKKTTVAAWLAVDTRKRREDGTK